MNKQRLVELLPVMQAFVNGEIIQCRVMLPRVQWTDCNSDGPIWADHCDYRVKPRPVVPKERWAIYNGENLENYWCSYLDKEKALIVVKSLLTPSKLVLFREVLE